MMNSFAGRKFRSTKFRPIRYIVRDNSMSCEEYSESIFRFGYALNMGINKEISPN